MKKRTRKLSVQILKAVATGAVIFFVLSSPGGTRRFLKGIRREWRNRNVRKALDKLQKRELVAYRMKGKIIEVEITNAGRKKIREYEAENIAPAKPKKWDGKWRIILSDIPETHKKARDALRRKFYEWGFYPLQKSVFVFPYRCEDEIAIMRDIFHVPTKNLLTVKTDHVGNEKILKKFFSLP